MSRTLRLKFLLVLFTFAAVPASAQGPATGTPPFGSFSGGPDVINLANLNAHLTVPILHKPGRGGFDFTYDLGYDSSVWSPVGAGSNRTWQPAQNWGWTDVSEVIGGYLSFTSTNSTKDNGNCSIITNSNYVFHEANGTTHSFLGASLFEEWLGADGQNTNCFSSTLTATAQDGSGIVLKASALGPGSLILPNGLTETVPSNSNNRGTTGTDRNGNQITVQSSNGSWTTTDTLGTSVLTIANPIPSATTPTTLSYTPPNTTTSKCAATNTTGVACFTINYTNYTVATNFGVSGINEYKSATAVPLLSSIVLPDGTQYSFTYEPTPSTPSSGACTPYSGTTCTTARLASMTLPTGGTISYVYYNSNSNFSACTTGNNGVFSDGSASCLQGTTPDGQWTYIQTKGTGAASATLITAPKLPYDSAANQTIVQFQGIYETQRDIYQGSAPAFTSLPISESTLQTSGLLREIQTCYSGSASPCTATAITQPIQQRTVIDQYGSSGVRCKHNYLYNPVGGLTERDDYDYVASGSTSFPLLKKTLITFASLGNITAFRQQVTIQNGTGFTISQTNYNYDENTPTATSGVAQHTSVTGSRGNLTSINYPVPGLTSHFTYYDTGTSNTNQDINSATTTFNYGSNSTANCQMAFPVSISEPLNLSRSFTWSCTGGVATQVTDENGHNVSTSYSDPYFWRPASATDQSSAVTNLTYTGQTSVESVLSINSGSTVDQLTTLDSLARPRVQQRKQSPTATQYDSVETDYDVVGRPTRTTLPYGAAAGTTTSPTTPGVIMHYDALGRPTSVTDAGGGTTTYSYTNNAVLIAGGPAPTGENTKRRQLEYDSIGRLTSVCEITSLAGSGICGQSSQQNGYWTKYTYDALADLLGVTQNAQAATASQQTRTYTYDSMGRLTSEKNPETSQNFITYNYDSALPCTPVSNGDLVKKIDPVGNTICFQYDALHRNTAVTYSGPYAANTPNKYFVYDSATVNSVAMTNAKTQLAEAYTATSPTGAKITDLGLSYTVRGEISDVYQSTPHSSGYYHLNQTYWPHGAPSQLSQLVGLPTITYGGTIGATVGLDGEGRITQVTAGSGQNPITGVTFNTSSLPTQVNFGSGDNDIFAYDPNTLRMTQFKFNVGTSSLSFTGNLTWNANSTLGQLAITDQFNSVDTQTCNYAHDDMTRIASVNCGASIWQQNFSYDPFGNITKTVPTGGTGNSFQPTYSTATNQISGLPGGFTPTYDANGNVKNDSSNTYVWDADNNSVTVDTVGVTYDALDRAVEQNRSGAYTQIVYGPGGGKLALMNGMSLVKAFVPLPSQATAVYTSSGLDHYRHSDHLGSARLTSSPSRTFVSSTAYAPFGETYAQSGTQDLSFTGEGQDTTSGGYDFLYRQYSTQGRWASPDPAGLLAVNPDAPQSWNRYAYVANSPLALTDPLGLDTCDAFRSGDDNYLGDLGLLCGDGGGGGGLGGGGFGGDFGWGGGGDWSDGAIPKCPYGVGATLLCLDSHGDIVGSYAGEVYCNGPYCSKWDASSYQWVPCPAFSFCVASINISVWDLLSVPWSGSVIFPLVSFGPVASAGAGPTVAYNPKTDTGCLGLAVGGMFPAGGRAAAVGPLAIGNLGNADNILAGGSLFAGAQSPNPFRGVQAAGNSSGLLAGPTVGTPGIVAGASASKCQSGVGKKLLKGLLDSIF